jgi:hypothetical protein
LILGFRESSRRDEEIRLLRQEGTRREEELGILREQLAADKEIRRHQLQAEITVETPIPTEGSARGIDYKVTLLNLGKYRAIEIAVDLIAADGRSAGTGTHDAMLPGEKAMVTVTTPPAESYFGPYEVWVEWTDGRGQIREATGVEVGRPG